jgi:hypothetical protein
MSISLPTSWNQVTISQWADIQQTLGNTNLNDIHKTNRILAALANVHLSEIESLPFKKVSELSSKLDWVNNLPNKIITNFKIKGVEYDVTIDVFRAATGQYADLTEFLKKEGYYKYAECAAVMCLPKGERYDSSKVEERAAIFWDNMTIDILYPMTGFFLSLLTESLPYLKNSLKSKLEEIQQMNREILTELGQGS